MTDAHRLVTGLFVLQLSLSTVSLAAGDSNATKTPYADSSKSVRVVGTNTTSVFSFVPLTASQSNQPKSAKSDTIPGIWKPCGVTVVSSYVLNKNSIGLKSVTGGIGLSSLSVTQGNHFVDVELTLDVPKTSKLVDFSVTKLTDVSGRKYPLRAFNVETPHVYYKLDSGMGVFEMPTPDDKLMVISNMTAPAAHVSYTDDRGATRSLRIHLLFEVPVTQNTFSLVSEPRQR